jgi:hypothetical protein
VKSEELRTILGPFADPATHFQVTDDGQHLNAEIIRDGEKRSYRIEVQGSGAAVRMETGQRFAALDSLLASAEFADLRGMVITQERLLGKAGTEAFLEPNLRVVGDDFEGSGFPSLKDALAQAPRVNRTRVVLLDGPAGIGKTRLLERLTWERAGGYVVGRAEPPILYVSSRGRRMSNLRDTLAGATEMVRPARITSAQVPILVRRNLLHLAIDGFDELVDSDGYQDAWFALRDFLALLNGEGTCILSGRDTFFDQQSFLERLPDSRIELLQAHLRPTVPAVAKAWLRERGWSDADVASPVTDEVLTSDTYVLRPYFLSVLAGARGWKAVTESTTVRQFLIDRFLAREASLLEAMVEIDRQEAIKGLEFLFQEAALDMAERESGEVDLEFLSLLCEYAFEGKASAEDVRKLQYKAGSFALLEQRSSERVRSFPHSEVFHHFLALAFLARLERHEIHAALRRAILGTDFLEVFEDVIGEYPLQGLQGALGFLQEVLGREITADRLISNGGALLVASLSRDVPDLERGLASLDLYEASLSGTACQAELRSVTIFRLDAREADMRLVTFDDRCKIVTLIGDSLTMFGDSSPDVSIVQAEESGRTETIRGFSEVRAWVAAHMHDSRATESLPLVQYFDRVCRRAIRQFYLRPGGDDSGADLLRSRFWPLIEKELRLGGHLDTATKSVSGAGAVMYHVRNPRALLAPGPSDSVARKIRDRIVGLARSDG